MNFWSWACRPLSFPHSCWSAITVFFPEGDFTHQGRCGDELRAGEHFERWVILSGLELLQDKKWGQRRFVRRAGEIRLSRATNACANTMPIKPAALRSHRLKMTVDLCILCERSLSYPTHRRRRSRTAPAHKRHCAKTRILAWRQRKVAAFELYWKELRHNSQCHRNPK